MTILKNIKENKGRITLAGLLIVSLMLITAGLYVFVGNANAAAITAAKDVLSDPRPGGTISSNHTLTFTINNAIAAGNTLTIDVAPGTFTFGTPAGFVNTDPLDYDITDDGAEKAIVADGTCVAEQFEIDSITAGVFQFTYCAGSTSIASGSVIVVEIGLNATNGGAGNTQMTNPAKVAAVGTADTPAITIGGTFGGSGDILVAIIEGVSVSVTIDETLSFSVATETAANCPATIPGTDRSDDAGHTATAITFGTLAAGNAFNHSCHLATVSTNAGTGYTTTAEKTQLLTSGGNTIADGTCDGACSGTVSATWATTTNNGFGYCLQDVTGNPALTTDSSNDAGAGAVDWEAVDQCNDATPQFKTYTTTATTEPVMKSFTAVSGDQIRMGTVLNYSATQAAGTYTTTLLFVTTPTF